MFDFLRDPRSCRSLIKELALMSAQLDTLTAQVKTNSAAIDKAVAEIARLKAIVATHDDPAALQALSDTIAADDAKVDAAVGA